MSEKKKKKKNPGYVTEAVCRERFGRLSQQIAAVDKKTNDIKTALVGEPFKGGGLIDEIKGIKQRMQSNLSGKDKATILTSLSIAIASIIIAWLK